MSNILHLNDEQIQTLVLMPNYAYTTKFSEAIHKFKNITPNKEKGILTIHAIHKIHQQGTGTTYHLEPDLIRLLLDTNLNNQTYQPLPEPIIYLDNDITIGETLHKGIYLYDTNQIPNKLITILINKDHIYFQKNCVGLCSANILPSENTLTWDYIENIHQIAKDLKEQQHNFFKKQTDEVHQDLQSYETFIQKLLNLTNNLIAILTYHYDEITVHHIDNAEQNRKRTKRNKPRLPPTTKYVYLTGIIKRYAEAYTQYRRENPFQSCVRGHLRHYQAARYTVAKGTIQWIFPYLKGAHLPARPRITLTKIKATQTFQQKYEEHVQP